MNHFIHHPTIQNNRQRGDTHTTSGIDERGVVHHVNSGGGGGDRLLNNIHDNEQFPLLTSKTSSSSSSSSSSNASLNSSEPSVTKLNFKEMVMKNSKPSITNEEESVANNRRDDVSTAPKVRTEYAQKALSSRNIFLGAFYGSSNGNGNGNGNGGDDDYDYEDTDVDKNNGHTVSASILIDSCDRKYDNLYK